MILDSVWCEQRSETAFISLTLCAVLCSALLCVVYLNHNLWASWMILTFKVPPPFAKDTYANLPAHHCLSHPNSCLAGLSAVDQLNKTIVLRPMLAILGRHSIGYAQQKDRDREKVFYRFDQPVEFYFMHLYVTKTVERMWAQSGQDAFTHLSPLAVNEHHNSNCSNDEGRFYHCFGLVQLLQTTCVVVAVR